MGLLLVCDCGTEQAVSILGLYSNALTSAWLGGRPPPTVPPISAGYQLQRGGAGGALPLPREYTPETLLPSSSLFFFFFCSPTLFLPLFCQSCVSLSSSCTRRRAVGLCCSDTLDVTTGLFVAIIQDVCLFIYFLFQPQNGQGFFFIIPTCHITCIRNFNQKLCVIFPMMQSSSRLRATSHMSNFNNSVCYARCLFKQSFNTNNSNQLVYTFKSAPCVVGKCV